MSTLQTNCYTMVPLAPLQSKLPHAPGVSHLRLSTYKTMVIFTDSCTRFQPWKHSVLRGGASPLVYQASKAFFSPWSSVHPG